MGYFSGFFKGLKSLFTGMRITGKYFVSPGEIVTQQYPDNRDTLILPQRSKGEVTMPHNADNKHRCTACGLCSLACPNGSIEVISRMEVRNEKQVKVLDGYIYHLEQCTLCGLCVKACPQDAIEFGNKFEHAVYNRQNLTKTLNLPGSSLLEKEKKAPAAAPKDSNQGSTKETI